MKRAEISPICISLILERKSRTPLQEQVAAHFRKIILDLQLRPGSRLPSTRRLASELNVSRQTVTLAFETLSADGYVEGRAGSGIFVCFNAQESFGPPRPKKEHQRLARMTVGVLSKRGQRTVDIGKRSLRTSEKRVKPHSLMPGIPAIDCFPTETWSRISSRMWRRGARGNILSYSDPAGLQSLRAAIASYLGETRGLFCNADDIIITLGAQQAIDLTIRLLLDVGDTAWIENPTYPLVRGAMESAGVRLCPVPVDKDGMNVAAGLEMAPEARLVLVTPSRQFPLGVTMTLARRLELLNWAERTGAWIIEDDYDGHHSDAGRRLSPLRALARPEAASRVVYVGTFSKMLAPGFRFGFAVTPPGLAAKFAVARSLSDHSPPAPEQAILSLFISEGFLATHIKRMRAIYQERRQGLLHNLNRYCGDLLEFRFPIPETGLYLPAFLKQQDISDASVCAEAKRRGLEPTALSNYFCQDGGEPAPQGLLLGFSYPQVDRMEEAVMSLREAIEECKK